MANETKVCKRCPSAGREEEQPRSAFNRSSSSPDGLQWICKKCMVEDNARRREAQRRERVESDYAALKHEDFEVGVGNLGETPAQAAERSQASKEKRQEFNVRMGEFASALHGAAERAAEEGTDEAFDDLPPHLGTFQGRLAEQERRFGNRRIARSVSIAAAHEALALRQFKAAASEFLSDKVVPTGYAARGPWQKPTKRTVVMLLSDLHLGANLSELDNPVPFRRVEEARRLEFLLRQLLDYKIQYRDVTELLLLLNGDMIEGLLGHDMRDGAPLTEQKIIFWRLFRLFIGFCAQQFPSVLVVCQPGNHGRDKMRHPGRATSSKWDGHEWQMYWALKEMCSGLPNVRWDIGFRAVSVVDLYGSKMLVTHGDTEVPIGPPSTKHRDNLAAIDRINASRIYGCEFEVAVFSHYHDPLFRPGRPSIVYNGMLVPPNGFARGYGYIRETCGMFMWEAVEGYPVGDVRFVEVGVKQDMDNRLGDLLPPVDFRQ